MIIWPTSRPVFRSGLPVVASGSGLVGTLGPIVVDPNGQLFGLTLTTFVSHGERARARTPSREMRFAGPAIAVTHPAPPFEPPVTTLLALLPIDAQASVDPLLALVEAPSSTAPVVNHAASPLILGRPTGRVVLGPALSLGDRVRVALPEEEGSRLLGGALRIDSSRLVKPIEPGEAGTAILAQSGELIGILIGVDGNAAYAAPVHQILAQNKLVPMSRAHLMSREARRAAEVKARSAQRTLQRKQSQGEIIFTAARLPTKQSFAQSRLATFVRALEPTG